MPRNSTGTYTLPQAPFTPNTTILSSVINSDFADIANALTTSIASNGSTPITAPIKFTAGSASAPGITFTSDATTGLYYPGTQKLGLTAGGVAALLMDLTRAGSGQDGNILQYGNGAIPTPVGMIQDFAGLTVPTGWFLCYGQAISRTDYAELFTVISTTYGSGNGSTTFNLPDIRGRFIAGRDNMGGAGSGRITAMYFGTSAENLGAVGGGQSQVLISSNLPAYTPSGSVTSNVTDPSHTHTYFTRNALVTLSSGGGAPLMWNSTAGANTGGAFTGISVSSSFSGDAQGGTSSAFPILPPAIILNKIIFAGRS